MALHYIIDGYNVINKVNLLKDKKLKDARDILLNFIDKYRLQGSSVNKVTVVFDGKAGVSDFRHNFNIEVIFTKNGSADDYIKLLVSKAADPKNIRVVTDDNDIKFSCRSYGAEILSVGEFTKKLSTKISLSKIKNIDFSDVSFLERKKINDELSRIWLKE